MRMFRVRKYDTELFYEVEAVGVLRAAETFARNNFNMNDVSGNDVFELEVLELEVLDDQDVMHDVLVDCEVEVTFSAFIANSTKTTEESAP